MTSGKHFGNYRIIAAYDGEPVVISRDASSVTYSARHLQNGKLVTLKVVPAEVVEPKDLPLFEAEATNAQLLEHPNIARVRDLGFSNNVFFCAMDPVNGQSLTSWVAINGPMPAEAALRVGRQVVNALGAAAFHSVPHNAISPDNILVVPGASPEGERPFVKVLGFGLARVRPPAPSAEFDNQVPLAAYQFAAPEQLDRGAVDFRTEIYSLGCTLWYLVKGEPPFVGSPAAVTAQQLMAEPPLQQLHDQPRALRDLLGRMLQKDPSRRPQDPVMLGDELGLAIAQFSGRGTLASRLGLLKKRFQRSKHPAVGTVLPVAAPPAVQPSNVGEVVEQNALSSNHAPTSIPAEPEPFKVEDELPAFADTTPASAFSGVPPVAAAAAASLMPAEHHAHESSVAPDPEPTPILAEQEPARFDDDHRAFADATPAPPLSEVAPVAVAATAPSIPNEDHVVHESLVTDEPEPTPVLVEQEPAGFEDERPAFADASPAPAMSAVPIAAVAAAAVAATADENHVGESLVMSAPTPTPILAEPEQPRGEEELAGSPDTTPQPSVVPAAPIAAVSPAENEDFVEGQSGVAEGDSRWAAAEPEPLTVEEELPAFAEPVPVTAQSRVRMANERTARPRTFAWKPRHLALAAAILLLGLVAAILLPQILTDHDSDQAAVEPAPIGEPVGVVSPEPATPEPANQIAQGTRPEVSPPSAQTSEGRKAVAAGPTVAPTIAERASSPPTRDTLVAATAAEASAEEEVDPESPAEGPKAEDAGTTVASSAAPPRESQNRKGVSPPITAEDAGTSEASAAVPPTESQNAKVVSRPESAEAAPDAPEVVTKGGTPAKRTTAVAQNEGAAARQAKSSRRRSRQSDTEVRRALPADLEEAEILSEANGAPRRTRRGQTRARFVGVAPSGEWIFSTPSGDGYAEPADGEVRRALPADEDE